MTVPSLHGDTRAFVSANRRLGRCIAVLAFAAGLACAGALGADLYHAGDFDVRWDNTLQYSAAFRLFPRDDFLVSYSANNDDGDRNFSPGLISNRLDALSELELTDGDFGLRLSAAAWYDSVYDQRNDNDSARTFNPFSVPHNEFTRAVRVLHGGDVQLMDAFVHGSFDVADIPVSFRIGRYTLLWGESVFFGANGIAGGQAPTDDIKEFEQPSAYSRNIFLPVWQASAVVQPTENIAVSLYYQFQWRKDQFPGSGSYFSYFDYLDQGGERYILPYFIGLYQYFYRIRDVRAPSSGQFGVTLLLNSPAFNYGFYALRFNAKEPQIYLTRTFGGRGAGTYQLVYPTGIELYGASFSTYLGNTNLAGELSGRRNMPLVSQAIFVPPGMAADASEHPLYAVGDTLHAQISTENTFSSTALWDRADLTAELAANDRLNVAKNPSALDRSRTHFALAFQASLQPQYFEVLPGLDLSVPIGFGYGLIGRSSTDDTQNAGAGNFEIGVSTKFRTVWQGSLTYTRFLGSPQRQPLADRDFVLLSFQRTF